MSSRVRMVVGLSLLAAVLVSGCAGWQPDAALLSEVDAGEYGLARQRVAAKVLESSRDAEARDVSDQDRVDRDYVLDQVRYAMVDLADGQYAAAETPFLSVYDLLRTQGVNDDNTIRTFFGTEEGTRYWKGDPFEQAAAFAYFAAQLAAVEDWENAAAAAQGSLFRLQDFSDVIEGADVAPPAGGDASLTESEVVYAEAEEAQAEAYRAAIDGGASEAEAKAAGREAFSNALDNGYQPIETNFAPGYFMKGLGRWASSIRLGEPRFEKEARDNFRAAVRYAPALEPVVEAIVSGEANTVFWVDYGRGPEKYATGYRDSIAEYRPGPGSRGATADSPLILRLDGATTERVGVAADFNEYALDHRWRSNEELRLVKAVVGDALLYSGLIVASQADDWTQVLVGLGIAAIGGLTTQSATADIRHNELIPQRGYFVATNVEAAGTTVELVVAGIPGTRLVLPGMGPPPDGAPLQFRYVRLNRTGVAPQWATSGRIVWANDYTGDVPGGDLPYILGGRCVRSPTAAVLREYQAAGWLGTMTLSDLRELYRSEGITWELTDQRGVSATHVLEGGTSLVAPPPGSVGFARLFCGEHPPYSGKSELLQDWRKRLGER